MKALLLNWSGAFCVLGTRAATAHCFDDVRDSGVAVRAYYNPTAKPFATLHADTFPSVFPGLAVFLTGYWVRTVVFHIHTIADSSIKCESKCMDIGKIRIPKIEITSEPTTGPWLNEDTMKRIRLYAEQICAADDSEASQPAKPPSS